ncbi:MAG TPA: DUF1801 domain-containing protein [Gemmatimonadaceae bacterium]|jgi:uncharacterized protein YdhG (YjbR/CyaY superfamily)
MQPKPANVDDYLSPLSADKRAALERLRSVIKSAAPNAEECISYNIPTYKLDGKMIVSFGAAANHCALYAGAHPIKAHEAELAAYDTSKGTIRFQPDHPLPDALVRKLVKTRVAERDLQRSKR